MKRILLCCLALSCCITGCGIRESQERITAESLAGERLVKLLWLYELQFPEHSRTNLAEIFESVGNGYPEDLHERFFRFRPNHGFTNSFYEKYVFAPPKMSNTVIGGEMILLSAMPFLDENGSLVRVVIFRTRSGYEGWKQKWLREETIREAFTTANVELPMPILFPKREIRMYENQIPWGHIRSELGGWTHFFGLGRSRWWIVPSLFATIVGSLLVFLFIWLGRRGRH